MRRYSACIEWLFAEGDGSFADRIRRAHAGGLTAVEFWRWSATRTWMRLRRRLMKPALPSPASSPNR